MREKIRREMDRDRRAVYVGVAVTTAATLVFFLLPDVLPVDEIRRWIGRVSGNRPSGNPLTPLRLIGGVVGGAVAGWMTSQVGSGAANGTKAAIYGLAVAYVIAAVFQLAYLSVEVGTSPPPLFEALIVPMINSAPLLVTHLFGGFVAGAAAHFARELYENR